MTETELTDRLREAIVLDGPDVWQRNGYLQEAQQAGLSPADAEKLAYDIGQEVGANSLLFQHITARIERMAQPARAQLYEQDLSQVVNAAGSLKLSPDFVRNRWVPKVLARLSPPAAEPISSPSSEPIEPTPPTKPTDFFSDLIESRLDELPALVQNPPNPTPTAPARTEPIVTQPAPAVRPEPAYPREPVRRETSRLYEQPPVVRTYTATPNRIVRGQGVTLEWDVENLLAVTIDDLGEGLSPKNRGWVKPTKTTDYTLFDANNNPLSTVRVVVVPPDRSGIYGVLFALALLALIYWFVKHNNAPPDEPAPRKSERSSRQDSRPSRGSRSTLASRQARNAAESSPADSGNASTMATLTEMERRRQPVASETKASRPDESESTPVPETPADARQGKYEEAFGDKPYDKVELGTDEQGWRRARANGRWGFVDSSDEWVIEPVYEAITPFRNDRAAAFQNGQLLIVNRAGERIGNQ